MSTRIHTVSPAVPGKAQRHVYWPEVFPKGVQSRKIQQEMHELHALEQQNTKSYHVYMPSCITPPPLYTTVTGVYLSSYTSYKTSWADKAIVNFKICMQILSF